MIPPDDLKVTCLHRYQGGQHVGVRTGVSVEHIPTGITATVEVSRSQFRNRELAVEMIEAALTSPNFR